MRRPAAASALQVRVTPKGDRSVVAFYEEHLPDPTARELRRAHFAAALQVLHRLGRGGD